MDLKWREQTISEADTGSALTLAAHPTEST